MDKISIIPPQHKSTMVKASATLRNGSTSSRLQLLIVCISLLLTVCASTNIKWTPASDATRKDGKETAATAPRSRNYWIENNIEIPDYAKTDAELALERGEGGVGGGVSPSTKMLLAFIVLSAAVGYVLLPRLQHGGGHTLQDGYGLLPKRHLSEEEARRARLSRFEAPDLSQFEAKDD
jgi:hypothetical protein